MKTLRPYQLQAVDAIIRDFEQYQSTLCVSPTGSGKSLIVAEVIRRYSPQGAIVLCHREELLSQMQATIEEHCKVECQFEQGIQKASEMFPPEVLLASIQTMISGRNGSRRMHKFSPFNHNLLVCDESHHSTSASWRAVIDYFKTNPDLKLLGVTATPSRSDEEALGQVYESVAFELSVLQAIRDGWLVSIQQQLIDIESLDFSHIKTVAGDLNQGQLAAVMEEERNLYGICDASMKELGNRKAIMFCVTTKQAEMSCEILNRYRSGVAVFASGKTNKEDRRRIIRDFREGKHQVFVNCDLVGEGFDIPDANLLIDATPTKSKLRYAQRLGRIMRPLAGCVDGLQTAAARKASICSSAKPDACVIDFVGNSGKHKLIHSLDILGGKISERARELAERELRNTGKPQGVDAIVLEAEQRERAERERQEAAKRARLTGRATYTKTFIDPFDSFDLIAPPSRAWDRSKHLTPKQSELLIKQGIDPLKLGYSEGKMVIDQLFHRWKNGLCSLKQAALLKRFGYTDTKNMTKVRAGELITALKANGWRKPAA